MAAPVTWAAVATVLLSACAAPAPDDTAPVDSGAPPPDTGAEPPEDAPGVLRLAPPAPSVGIYGIAAPPGRGRVYVSNLHVPFLTVLDSASGALLDAVDLREGCTDRSFFPRLYAVGHLLWVTDTKNQRLCRYDLDAAAWLEPVTIEDMRGGFAVDGGSLWISTTTELLRHDADAVVERIPAPGAASALDVEDGALALLLATENRVAILESDGALRWDATVEGSTLNDIALLDGAAYVTDRSSGSVTRLVDGAVAARVVTGSDTFEVDRLNNGLLVTNRQGAALPASGAYEGAPSLVTSFAPDLVVRWRAEVDKTIHFLAYDGERLWTANEDALRVSAIDPASGREVLRTDPLGLTVDHLTALPGAWYFGSHLTDEVWRVTPDGGAQGATVCGWPFVTVPMPDGLVVPCQEDAEVWTLDPETLSTVATADHGDTLFPVCADGLCTGHDLLVSATADGDAVVFTDPHAASLRWTDGRTLALSGSEERARLRHFDVAPVDGRILAYEPRTTTLHAIADGAAVASVLYSGDTATFPLVPDGARVWLGGTAFDGTLTEQGSLPDGHVALAAGSGWLVAQSEETLVVFDAAALTEVGRLPLTDLRVPPWLTLGDVLGPMRYRVDGTTLLVANTMRGTIERRALPDLTPLGDDAVYAAGRWAALPGLR